MAQLQFLELIISFCTLVDSRSNVTGAAKKLGISQPALSMQIKRLENRLGYPLFFRSGKKLVLTKDGERFYISISGYAKTFREFEKFNPILENLSVKAYTLKILGNTSSYHYILPHLTKLLISKEPKVNLSIHFGESDDALKLLENGMIDVAILPRRAHAPFPDTFEYYPLFYYSPCLITLKDHPLAGKPNISVDEISQYNLILPSPELIVIPNLYDIFPKHHYVKTRRIQFMNIESSRKFVEADIAITISSDIIIEKNEPLLAATPLTHLFAKVDYGIVVSKNHALPPIWELFFTTCQEYAISL
jgi:LysR family cys regulon transcriptional activator